MRTCRYLDTQNAMLARSNFLVRNQKPCEIYTWVEDFKTHTSGKAPLLACEIFVVESHRVGSWTDLQ